MIHIPTLRTKRLTLQLRELSIGDSLAVLAIPEQLEQATTTEFLKRAMQDVKGIADPANWTVQERAMATAHYMSSVADDGPDFSVGHGKYSDYLDASSDYKTDTVQAGELGGDVWLLRHLTGAMAESIERLQGEVTGISGRLHWMIGAMAAQMIRDVDRNDGDPEHGAIDEWMLTRMQTFVGYPESDFAAMVAMFQSARGKLKHLFHVDFSDTGLIFLPKGGDEAEMLPPARFPAYSCISEFTRGMVGQFGRDGS